MWCRECSSNKSKRPRRHLHKNAIMYHPSTTRPPLYHISLSSSYFRIRSGVFLGRATEQEGRLRAGGGRKKVRKTQGQANTKNNTPRAGRGKRRWRTFTLSSSTLLLLHRISPAFWPYIPVFYTCLYMHNGGRFVSVMTRAHFIIHPCLLIGSLSTMVHGWLLGSPRR